MDYEFRIQLAERELAHLKELQQMQRSHLDTHDQSIEAIHGNLALLISANNATAQNLESLTARVDTLATKIDTLVDALLRQPRNGH